jgi:hypothetical protein
MIEDLNQADQDRTDKHGNPLRTTIGVGDRLVEVSSGLGGGPEKWVKGAAAREMVPDGPLHKLVRWFTEPTRRAVWDQLSGGAATHDRASGLAAVNKFIWFGVAVLGGAAVAVAVVMERERSWWLLLLGAGAVLAAAGVALALLTMWLSRLRHQLSKFVDDRLRARLNPDTPPRAGGLRVPDAALSIRSEPRAGASRPQRGSG